MWDWTIKKVEHRRIDAVKLWCWGILLRVLWTARRSSLSILKEFRSGCSLEGLMLKLKLQYFGHLMWRADSFEKTLMLGKIEGRRSRRMTEDGMVGWHHHLNGHGFVWTPGVGLARWGSRGHKESDTTERLNWTDLCCCLVAKLSPSLCYPTDCSLPGSSVHGIFQPRILEWVAISFSIVYL